MGLVQIRDRLFRKSGGIAAGDEITLKGLWRIALENYKPIQKTLDQYAKEYEEYRFPQLRQICRDTPSIVNARIVLREHVFKNRLEWQPAFGSKCLRCGAEYEQAVDRCENCNGYTYEPNQKQQEAAEEFFEDVNEYDDSFLDVLEKAEDEINMTDYAALWLNIEYTLNPIDSEDHLKITGTTVKGIESIPPEHVKHNLDGEGRHKDEWFCIQHRTRVFNSDKEFCPVCGTELLQAWYCYDDRKADKRYYARTEIIDWHFYDLKGYSPVYSIMKPVLVEWGMDDELWERFWNKVLPKDIIAVVTSNVAALDKTKHNIIEQAKNNEIPFVGIESTTGRGVVQKIPLTDDSVADLTNITTRDQIKKIINTVYGIVPIYSADVERSSALSGEGQQLLVQEDRAKAKQTTYNEKVIPQVLKALHVTDWKLMLKPPTEESEQKRLTIESMKIQNATAMLQMGFKVELDENGDFVFSGEASRPDVTMPSPFAASTNAIQKSEEDDWTFTEEEELLIKARWEEVIEAIQQGTLWSDYYGLTRQESLKINNILEAHFTQPYISLRKIREDLVSQVGLPEARADLIGRMEMSAVMNKARELDYTDRDPEGKWRYKWLNPKDHLTTECCKRIVDRTANGVSMEELKAIVKEESLRYSEETDSDFSYVREFVPHFGCRSIFTRVVT